MTGDQTAEIRALKTEIRRLAQLLAEAARERTAAARYIVQLEDRINNQHEDNQ